MKIGSINSAYSFKGYDARPLKGFVCASDAKNIDKEFSNIIDKVSKKSGENYDVVTLTNEYLRPNELIYLNMSPYAQDYVTLNNGKLFSIFDNEFASGLEKLFGVKQDETEKIKKSKTEYAPFSTYHVEGGNMFIVKNKEGNDDIFVGEDVLKSFTNDEIKKMYKVDKVISIPQADFHLDLFMRPLDNQRVLISDDNMSVDVLVDMLNDLVKYCYNGNIDNMSDEERKKFILATRKIDTTIEFFKTVKALNKYQDIDSVEKTLKDNGYEPIRVPARIYCGIKGNDQGTQLLTYFANYANGNAFKDKNGEIIYITNNSQIDNILGLDDKIKEGTKGGFQEHFIKAVSPYIKSENIYFIDGDENAISKLFLPDKQAGIHCLTTEIPKE